VAAKGAAIRPLCNEALGAMRRLLSWKPFQIVATMVADIIHRFNRDDASVLAAGLAFYALISIAPLGIIVVVVGGAFISREEAQEQLAYVIEDTVSPEAAEQIISIIVNTRPPTLDSWAAILTIGVLLFGSMRIFAQLQIILNRTWGVTERRMSFGQTIMIFIKKRLLAFSMVGLLAAALLTSLVVNTAMQAGRVLFADQFGAVALIYGPTLTLISLVIGAIMIAVLFKVLPDAWISWRDALVGGLFTSTLFNIGKYGIERYLAVESADSGFGPAGSLLIVLLWLYYSSIIFLIGAEFTESYARRHGQGIWPQSHAISVPEPYQSPEETARLHAPPLEEESI